MSAKENLQKKIRNGQAFSNHYASKLMTLSKKLEETRNSGKIRKNPSYESCKATLKAIVGEADTCADIEARAAIMYFNKTRKSPYFTSEQ